MVPPPLFFSHCTLNPPDKLTNLGENHPKEKNISVFSQLQLSELTDARGSMLAGTGGKTCSPSATATHEKRVP